MKFSKRGNIYAESCRRYLGWGGGGGDRVCTKAQRQERTWPVMEITNN